MIIKKIHIENFGRLQDFTLDLNEGLNQILSENGFGKTTLSIFIKSIFYGMPPARENLKMERKKYMPWQGGKFGGYIEFEQKNTLFRATRFFSKTPEGDSVELLNKTTNKIVDLKGYELGEVLFGVGRETFEMTAFFPQLNFSVLANNQISANILGLEKFKYDLENLNSAIAQIKKKIAEIKKDKPKKEDIEYSKQKLKEVNIEIAQIETRISSLNKEITICNTQLSNLENEALKQKKLKDQLLQIYENKRKIEDDIREKQEKLNIFLKELTDLNNQKNMSNDNRKEKSKKEKVLKFFAILLIVLPLIAISAIVICLILNLSELILILLTIPVIICGVIWLVLVLLRRKKVKNNNSTNQEQKTGLLEQIEIYNKQIESLKQNLFQYEGLNSSEISVPDSCSEAIYKKRLDLQSNIQQCESLKQNLDMLIEKSESLISEINHKEEMLCQTTNKIEMLTKTKDFLMRANENVASRFIDPANKSLREILSKFNVRNREFVVDTNFEVKEITPLGVKEQEYSSQGYRDILAFCVRMYFLKEIYKKEKPFIVLDDTFVNLDDENLKQVKRILEELSKEYQIIYLCCNSRCSMK